MSRRFKSLQQNRFSLGASDDEVVRQEVLDALAASPEERLAAAIAPLDATYDLWSR